jgi:arylformamidase
MFIHGGYWQGLDKSFASHLAAGLLAQGVAVAVPSYDLCPAVTLADIVGQIGAAARFLIARHGRLDVATGHSAGGHLAAMLLAEGLVPAAVPISGLFDLRPLVRTTINGALGLDAAAAWALSPLRLPRPGGRLHAVVGGDEGPEYAAQSRGIAQAWGGRCEILPGHDHFTIPGELVRPDSAIVAAISAVL